ncbi:MAG: hypothetical protein PHU85_03080 [Phycisphaerae bacterium]|nr:hypothetical protein [Phycisphaerae bacterium]
MDFAIPPEIAAALGRVLWLTVLVGGLVQAVKTIPGVAARPHLIPWISIGLGVVLTAIYQSAWPSAEAVNWTQRLAVSVLCGAIVGAFASGAYSALLSPLIDKFAKGK